MVKQCATPGRPRFFFRPPAALFLFFLPLFLHANALEDSRRALLVNILTERKIPFETRPLFAGFGGFGSSVHVPLAVPPGTGDKKPGSFILALPLSFTGDDGREFPYGFETALDFIGRVRDGGLQIDATVAFLGDEWSALQGDQDTSAPHLGLRDLYSRLELPEDAAMIYLDMCEAPGQLVIHHGARRTLAPLNMLRPLARLCAERQIPHTLAFNANEIYKLGLADGPSALEFALGRELPALYLAGGGAPRTGSAGEGIQNLDALLFDYARAVDPGAENPDYHYLVFQAPLRFFFVSEYATVLLLLAAAALFFFAALTYSVAFRRRLTLQWNVFFKRSWILPLYWLALVLALKGAALIFQGIARGTDPALLWGNPLLFYAAAMAQLLAGASLFIGFSFLGDFVHVPRRANFYGSSAVILVIAEMLLSAYIDITFIPVFVWAFVFTFLAACVRKPVLVWLCALLAFFQGAAALHALVRTGSRELGFLIFSGDTAFILYVALASLPFFITLKRGALLFARRSGEQMSPGELLQQLANPGSLFRRLAPRLVLFASVAALAAGLFFMAQSPDVPAGQRTLAEESEGGELLDLEALDRVFLERRILNITLRAPGNPVRFNLFLEGHPGGEAPLIYSAPMPFRYLEEPDSPDRSSVEFLLGEGPPNPFVTEIVLPLDFSGLLRAEAVYMEGGSRRRITRRYPVGAIDLPAKGAIDLKNRGIFGG
jgi:hypothetical protein